MMKKGKADSFTKKRRCAWPWLEKHQTILMKITHTENVFSVGVFLYVDDI